MSIFGTIRDGGGINSRLKYIDLPAIDIGRKGPYADVIGFAQSDMIDRFLHGVDPAMYTYVEQLITNSIEYTAREIVAGITNVSSQSVTIPKSLALVIKKIQDDQVQNLLAYKKEYAKPIVNMIRHMPKQEISALAKALIDLTSLKRHVSQEQETVGGEVDVAVISKSEGFVWVSVIITLLLSIIRVSSRDITRGEEGDHDDKGCQQAKRGEK